MSDASEILSPDRFIDIIFPKGSKGWIEFRLIQADQPLQRYWFTRDDIDNNWPKIFGLLQKANASGFNVYMGVNPRTEKGQGDLAHIDECHVLWCDIDYKGDLAKKNCEPLKQIGLEPSIIIDSGHGYHLYWILKEPMSRDETRPIVEQLVRVLGGDKQCVDASRILRLPGTMNVKREPFIPCRVLRYNLAKHFTAFDYDPLSTMASGTLPEGKGKKAAPTTVPPSPATGTKPASNSGHYTERFAGHFNQYWAEGKRHHIALALAGMLRKEEVKYEDAVAIVTTICQQSGDTELTDRLIAVKTTYESQHPAGSTKIMELLGDKAREFFKTFNENLKTIPPPPIVRSKFPEFNFTHCIPLGGMFENYIVYADKKTDAPLQYHAAAIATIGAAALGNRVFVRDYYGKKLFPTLYSMLSGPSSLYRKTTSVMLAHKIAKAAKVRAYPNNATSEQLYSVFADRPCEFKEEVKKGQTKQVPIAWEGNPSGIIYHPEFTHFLDASSKSYMADSRSMLMDFYDGVADREMSSKQTKTQGKYYIEDPAVSLLCGITPIAIKTFLGKSEIGNGFLSRFLIMMEEPDHQNRFGRYKETAEDLSLYEDIVNRMTVMAASPIAAIDLSPEAEELSIEFEKELSAKIKAAEGTPLAICDPFLTRLQTMSIKIAMVYAYGTRTPADSIEVEDLQPAINLCRYSASLLEHFFDTIRPDDGNWELRFKNTVLETMRGLSKRNGLDWIPHRMVIQYSNLGSDQVGKAVTTLEEEGRIQKMMNGRSYKYKLNEITR